jgi:hypothetical protein
VFFQWNEKSENSGFSTRTENNNAICDYVWPPYFNIYIHYGYLFVFFFYLYINSWVIYFPFLIAGINLVTKTGLSGNQKRGGCTSS